MILEFGLYLLIMTKFKNIGFILTCLFVSGFLARLALFYHGKLMADVKNYGMYYGKQAISSAMVVALGNQTVEWKAQVSTRNTKRNNTEVGNPSTTLEPTSKTKRSGRALVSNETLKTTTLTATVTVPAQELCSKTGEKLVGPLPVDQTVLPTDSHIQETWHEKDWVEKGGAWRPKKCQAVSKVAVIIPYRKREEQLRIFLRHIHPMLKRQLLDYRIMIIEQDGVTPFNRAMLLNIGYKESLKFQNFTCFVFHDVDLMPEDDRNYYGCPSSPRHMSVGVDKFNYRLPYRNIFGGAGCFLREHFELVNGFSNEFWGWGGEDDDLFKRITAKRLTLTRPGANIGRYQMLRVSHTSAKPNPSRRHQLKSSTLRMANNGLNSLKYNVKAVTEHPFYTKVTVIVNPEQSTSS